MRHVERGLRGKGAGRGRGRSHEVQRGRRGGQSRRPSLTGSVAPQSPACVKTLAAVAKRRHTAETASQKGGQECARGRATRRPAPPLVFAATHRLSLGRITRHIRVFSERTRKRKQRAQNWGSAHIQENRTQNCQRRHGPRVDRCKNTLKKYRKENRQTAGKLLQNYSLSAGMKEMQIRAIIGFACVQLGRVFKNLGLVQNGRRGVGGRGDHSHSGSVTGSARRTHWASPLKLT